MKKNISIKTWLAYSGTLPAPCSLQGWVRTKRESKHVLFIHLNDGSTPYNMQIIAEPSQFDEHLRKQIQTGASIAIQGKLVASQGKGQGVEVQAEKIHLIGEADPSMYPLQPKAHSMEFLREQGHLRVRTATMAAVFRLRSRLAMAIHRFFEKKEFFTVHTPIITSVDAEGAGEMFQVTHLPLNCIPKQTTGEVDYGKDFFGKPVNLTVSGQLAAETAALGLGKVYTFGPTFRAENSHTSRHLAEFWMVEAEEAFADLDQVIDLALHLLREVTQEILEKGDDDLALLEKRQIRLAAQEKVKILPLREKIKSLAEGEYVRMTYTEAIELLQKATQEEPKRFKFPVTAWGADLQTEHEQYLTQYARGPVVVTHYPKEIKAFYMRADEDECTVAALDVLLPGIGEVIGGAQREERLEKLIASCKQHGMDENQLDFYLDTRRFGSVPHGGFGLGFDRLLLFITGMSNIRDVVPFPRTPGQAAC